MRNGHGHPNLLDRLIGYVSPQSAARRLHVRNFISQLYEGANYSTARSWLPVWPVDARYQAPTWTRLALLSHARYLYANSGYLRGAVNDLRRYSLGPYGLRPESNSENAAWGKEAEDFFNEWCKIADATGRFTFGDLQRMAVLVAAIDGDCGMILTKTDRGFPKLQFIEGHQIQEGGNPEASQGTSVDGVIVDDANAPLAYRIMTTNAAGQRVPAIVDAANFIHFFDPERYSGTRGVSWLAHAINNGRDIFDLISYEKRFLHNACSRTLMQTTVTGSPEDDGEIRIPAAGVTEEPTLKNVQVEHLEGGLIDYLRAGSGEKLEAFQFERPTAVFREFMDYLESDGYIGLGLPANWKNLHKEGGATLRAALVKSQRRFDEIAAGVENRICNRVWNWVTAVGAKQKRIAPRPPDAYKVQWYGPAKATVDAGREAIANRDDILMCLRSYQEDYAERGLDARRQARKIAEFQKYLHDLAAEFKIPIEELQQRYPNPQSLPSEERITV